MKKICLKALLLCCGFLLFNCQNDDSVAASKLDHFEISIERKSFKEFHDLPALVSKHIGEGRTDNAARGGHTDPLYDFEIDSTSVTQIIKEGKTYYTMAIYRAESIGNSFENLVISNDGVENTAHIIKYFPSQEYLLSLETNVHAPFVGEINIMPLDYDQLMGRSDITCYTYTQAYCGNGPAGTAAGPGCYNHSDGGAHVYTKSLTFCKESTNINYIIGDPENPGNGGGGTVITPPNTTPIVTEPILLFAERQFVNGLSAEQKLWWNNAVNSHEKQLLISYMQNNNSSSESVVFSKWAIDYLRTHPLVTMEQFKNWFMGKSEGQDGNYNAAYWDNSNLIFPAQNLPTWTNFEANYPKKLAGPEVYKLVGGPLYDWHLANPEDRSNACALRVSRALNYSGVSIPAVNGTFKGGDGKNYFLSAKALNKWMRKTFGVSPTNPNHYNITKSEAGEHGVELPTLLSEIKGIYSMVSPNGSTWASGHVDLLYDNSTCDNNCYFYDGDILYIDIWELN